MPARADRLPELPRSLVRVSRPPVRLAVIGAFAALYFLAGKLGLALAFVNASATAVWPPTGISLAAFLLFGPWIWPGVLLGAFLVNLTTAGTIATSIGIAAGNTLEGLLGCYLVNRFARGRKFFEQPQDIFKFAALASVASALSATMGVTSLALPGFAEWTMYPSIWSTWWLGDAAGALVVTPFLLLWTTKSEINWTVRRVIEAALLAVSLWLVGSAVFAGLFLSTPEDLPLEFLCFPLLIWSGFRFGQREAATAILILSGIAIAGTLRGFGPFARADQNGSLLLLQAFMAVVSVMILAMAGAVAQKRRAEDRIRRINQELERRVRERTRLLQVANAQLLRSESRLLEAQGLAHIGSWEWDIARDRIWWSEELFRIYGLEPETFTASYAAFLDRVHPEDRERVHGIVAAAMQDSLPFSFEHRIVRPGGAVLTIAAQGRVELDDEGKPARMMGTGQDVTERKHAEEERAQLILEQSARFEAEKANRMKDEFLAVLSHELRTPLNAIFGWAQLLETGKLDAAGFQRAIETIRRNSQVQGRLISDILDISSMESGKLVLKTQPVDLAGLIEAALDTVRPDADAKQVVLNASLDRTLPMLQGDPDRLQQSILNVLSNAVTFARDDGRVEVRLTGRDGWAEIQVEDDGPGVSSELLPHIFDRFRQGDSSSTRRHRGLGLGLTIVRRLVELHGGTAAAGNRSPSGGAIFTIRLPLRTPVPSAQASNPPAAGPAPPTERSYARHADSALSGIRILVVDDDKDSRELAATVLASAGAKVVESSSVSEALGAVAEERPDVLITDLEMPEEDGYTLLRKMRSISDDQGVYIPAIAVTAYARKEDVSKTLRAGFQAHIAKPFEPDELVDRVRELMGRARRES